MVPFVYVMGFLLRHEGLLVSNKAQSTCQQKKRKHVNNWVTVSHKIRGGYAQRGYSFLMTSTCLGWNGLATLEAFTQLPGKLKKVSGGWNFTWAIPSGKLTWQREINLSQSEIPLQNGGMFHCYASENRSVSWKKKTSAIGKFTKVVFSKVSNCKSQSFFRQKSTPANREPWMKGEKFLEGTVNGVGSKCSSLSWISLIYIYMYIHIFQNTFDILITENSTVSPLGRNSSSVSVKIGDFALPEKTQGIFPPERQWR